MFDADFVDRNRHGPASWPMPAFATARLPGRYAGIPQRGTPVSMEGGTAVLHFNANVPRTNGPETPSPHPTPGIPKYPHLSTTTDTPVHPPTRTLIPAPEPSGTAPTQPRTPDTRTTNPTTHTPIAVHPATNPDQTPKPPGQTLLTATPVQPLHTRQRPRHSLTPSPVRSPHTSPATALTWPPHTPTHHQPDPPTPLLEGRERADPGFHDLPALGYPSTP